MKKTAIIICVLVGLTGITFLAQPFKSGSIAEPDSGYIHESPEKSQEELYRDMFITALDPHIQKAITDYYGKPFMYGLESVDILDIIRPHGYRTFEFEIKLQVKPFVGAHNTVGIDNITMRVKPGQIMVERFEHIKSFELPPHLKNYSN